MVGPKVLAYEARAGLTLWCMYCREWYRRGRGAGHRQAHWRDVDNPYLATGYDLVVGAMTSQVRRSIGGRR